MRNQIITKLSFAVFFSLIMSSCATSTYLMTSEGESFDALSKITDSDKPSINPHGGDENGNLVFAALENDGVYNIYLKDNVLSKAIIQKTSGDNFNLAPNFL
ncbi:hypothetical protein [Zobellia laminariae]|uniref:hypothetical protein n=1 Tax=Zobellia laminariae TaxID=248906 RepID=UPI0026F43EF5|nr:hypothetical protein [Zobellia laminariae]WKX74761.1 hypothetical protein Q5W13_13205 [Zobellia laminariae]